MFQTAPTSSRPRANTVVGTIFGALDQELNFVTSAGRYPAPGDPSRPMVIVDHYRGVPFRLFASGRK